MPKPTLIYFRARGRAEVIRLLLAEAGVDYDEHPVGKDLPPHNGQPTELIGLRDAGLLPFGGVPVWVDADGFRLAQSAAIAHYLALVYRLAGSNPREQARVEETIGAIEDVRVEIRRVLTAAPGERAGLRAEFASGFLPRWLGYLDRQLAANRDGTDFVAGAALTVADLALFFLLESLRDNELGAAIDAYPRLVAFARRIAERPRIAAYLASPRRPPFTAWPK